MDRRSENHTFTSGLGFSPMILAALQNESFRPLDVDLHEINRRPV